jgi:hypothetical protein
MWQASGLTLDLDIPECPSPPWWCGRRLTRRWFSVSTARSQPPSQPTKCSWGECWCFSRRGGWSAGSTCHADTPALQYPCQIHETSLQVINSVQTWYITLPSWLKLTWSHFTFCNLKSDICSLSPAQALPGPTWQDSSYRSIRML